MKGKQRKLIVDDEHDITFVREMMLNDRYDLILFDYLMPKMKGFEFYRVVKQIDPNVNICMMTAY